MKKIKHLCIIFLAILSLAIVFYGCAESVYDKGVKLAKGASNVEATKAVYSNDNGFTKEIYELDGDTILCTKKELNSNGETVKSTSCWYIKQGDKYLCYQSSTDSSEIDKATYDAKRKRLNTGNLIGLVESYSKDTNNWTFGLTATEKLKEGVDAEFCIIFCIGGKPRTISERWGYKDNKLIYKNSNSNNGISYSYDKITLDSPLK